MKVGLGKGLALLMTSTLLMSSNVSFAGGVNVPTVRGELELQKIAAAAKTIQQIRDDIKAANDRDQSGPYEAIVPYLADQLETVHNPAIPSDGMKDGKRLGRSLPLEHKYHDAIMANRKFDVSFTVTGPSEIDVKGNITYIQDGEKIARPVHIVWTFDQGKIIRILVDNTVSMPKDGAPRKPSPPMPESAKPLYEAWMKSLKE